LPAKTIFAGTVFSTEKTVFTGHWQKLANPAPAKWCPGSPVQVLMLSIQAVRRLPRLHAPGIVLCIISFSRQLLCFLMV